MNIKTRIEKVLHLEATMSEEEATSLDIALQLGTEPNNLGWGPASLKTINTFRSALRRENPDEKTILDDVSSCADDILSRRYGPEPDVPVGETPDDPDAGCSRTTSPGSGEAVPEHPIPAYGAPPRCSSGFNPDAFDSESALPRMRADLSASSTDANLRLAKLAGVCSGRREDAVDKSFDKFSHGPVEPKWDKPRW